MKAGSGTDNRTQRTNEAEALVAQLNAVRTHFGDDQDIVIIGDTNVRNGSEDGLDRYTAAGLRDLNSTNTTTVAFGDRPFDRAFVPTGQPEFASSTQTILSLANPAEREKHRIRLSDHLPIVLTIDIGADDD